MLSYECECEHWEQPELYCCLSCQLEYVLFDLSKSSNHANLYASKLLWMTKKMTLLSAKVASKGFLIIVALLVGYRCFRYLIWGPKSITDPSASVGSTGTAPLMKKEEELEDLGANAGELVDMGDITESNANRWYVYSYCDSHFDDSKNDTYLCL